MQMYVYSEGSCISSKIINIGKLVLNFVLFIDQRSELIQYLLIIAYSHVFSIIKILSKYISFPGT